MGSGYFGGISERIAKIGLRGLGINIDHGIESTAPGSLDRFANREVKMSTVDAIVNELGWLPQSMKIDVEGFELAVLSGARELLASGVLSYVQFEFGPII